MREKKEREDKSKPFQHCKCVACKCHPHRFCDNAAEYFCGECRAAKGLAEEDKGKRD